MKFVITKLFLILFIVVLIKASTEVNKRRPKRQVDQYTDYVETTTKKKILKKCPTNAAGKRIKCRKKKKTTTVTTIKYQPVPPSWQRDGAAYGIEPYGLSFLPEPFSSPKSNSSTNLKLTTTLKTLTTNILISTLSTISNPPPFKMVPFIPIPLSTSAPMKNQISTIATTIAKNSIILTNSTASLNLINNNTSLLPKSKDVILPIQNSTIVPVLTVVSSTTTTIPSSINNKLSLLPMSVGSMPAVSLQVSNITTASTTTNKSLSSNSSTVSTQKIVTGVNSLGLNPLVEKLDFIFPGFANLTTSSPQVQTKKLQPM
ncbi:hypothetical protein PVAND_003182 [Polypedilum vanderplanki]|uniref:Uncharacterized protein n=1 Tax=Polypedilum vanderplanki TaxID=319348 RepID=A0A9J6BTA4_POLVA|nr:hypothetical protein PVAND_003182 [Polypedilum vanderplanki]